MLVVDGGPNDEETIPLAGSTTSMGRQSANEVVVAETGVSRKHAEIVQTDNGYFLRDLGSTNGTFVNSKKISDDDYLLQDGDAIRLGASKTSCVFRSPTSSTLAITLDQLGVDAMGEDATKVMPEPAAAPATMITELPVTTQLSSQADQDEPFEGTVQIEVHADGSMGKVLNFMQQIGEKSEIRVLKMANNRDGGVDVSLALRQPIPLRRVLGEVDGVADVSTPEDGDVAIAVTLQADSSSCVYCKEPLGTGDTVCPSCGKTQA